MLNFSRNDYLRGLGVTVAIYVAAVSCQAKPHTATAENPYLVDKAVPGAPLTDEQKRDAMNVYRACNFLTEGDKNKTELCAVQAFKRLHPNY
jgi:hypothetical protein